MDEYSSHVPGKEAFHKKYKSKLRAIAKALGLLPGQYDVRSNKGGPAVLGEVILHTDTLYVSVGGLDAERFMFRSCNGRKDYSGGVNRWMSTDALDTPERCLNAFRQAMAASGKEGSFQPFIFRHIGD
jgi:hypothetical protein